MSIGYQWEPPAGMTPDTVLYGSRLYGGFVNSTVTALFPKLPDSRFQLFHNFTGIIPLFHHSTEKCPIGCEWELPAGMARGVFQPAAFWEWPVVTALFTKLPDCLPPYRTAFGNHSVQLFPRHFSVLQGTASN